MTLVILSLALLLACGGCRLGSNVDRASRFLLAASFASAAVLAGLVIISAFSAPYSPWDTVRIAPAMAFLHGFPLYAGQDSGVVLSTMYGPFATLAFVPAALAGQPSITAILGRLLSFAYVITPIALLANATGRKSSTEWKAALLAIAAAALILLPSLRYSAMFVHADAPALGLMGAAGLLAARKREWPCAIGCGLAVATKQTLVPLPLALIAAAVWTSGFEQAKKRALAITVAGLTIALVCCSLANRADMILNIIRIPGGVPWRGQFPMNVIAVVGELIIHAVPFGVAWILLSPGRREPDPFTAADPLTRTFLLIAIAMIPMAILGRVKQAGDINSFSPVLYPLVLALLAKALKHPPATAWRRVAIGCGLAALSVFGLVRLDSEARILAKLRPSTAETDFLLSHPGEIYLPWDPAAHLAAEGRPTHHLFSAWERGEAGFPVSREHLLEGIPSGCRYVAFPLKRLGPVVGSGSSFQMLQKHGLIDPDAKPVRLAGLPDYECYPLR